MTCTAHLYQLFAYFMEFIFNSNEAEFNQDYSNETSPILTPSTVPPIYPQRPNSHIMH